MPYVNNKGTDQPAHPHSLISAFVVPFLDSTIPVLAKSDFNTQASLCCWAGQFESYLIANPEDRFSHDVAHNIGGKKERVIFGLWHDKINKMTCALSKDSDKPGLISLQCVLNG